MSLITSKIIPYVLGAGIAAAIAFGMLVVNDARASTPSTRALGPYMLMQHSNPTAAAGVFRVNVNTGYVSYCYIDQSNKPSVTCTAETP